MSGSIGSVSEGRARSLFNINPIIRFFDSPRVARDKVGYYVSKGQRVADLPAIQGTTPSFWRNVLDRKERYMQSILIHQS